MATFTVPTIFTAIDKYTGPVSKMQKQMQAFGQQAEQTMAGIDRKMRPIGKAAAVVGTAIIAPLGLAAKQAIEFEDRMADVAKTTGMEGAALRKLGDDLLTMSLGTRTSIDDLVKIAEIGGQLGIAKKDLLGFTDSINKFNVALGADFAGGVEEASSSIGKMKSLFKETRNLNIADAINRSGSAINALGAAGNATSPNIADFTLRIGALPDAIKPTIQNTQALAAMFEEAGITSEIAARGFGDLILTASADISPFAKQMNLTASAAKKLIESRPDKFASDFAKSLNKLSGTELAKKLAELKIGDTGTIKVVGALGTKVDQLAYYQKLANDEFGKGTSLIDEYNKKNETAKAKIEQMENNFKAFSIMIGTEVIPMVLKLINVVKPYIKTVIDWTRKNPELTKTIVKVAVGIAGLAFAITGIAGVIALATKAMAVFNFVMAMNPIGLVIIAIVTLIGLVTAIIYYWEKWGALVAFMFGPFRILIGLIMSVWRNWDMIKQAFQSGGILEGIKAIGATLLDVVLLPLQQILGLVASITGADWAKKAVGKVEAFRKDLGVKVSGEEEKKAVNNKLEAQNAMSRIETNNNQKVSIDIADQTGRAKMRTDNNFVPVRLGSTMKFGM